MSGCPIPMSSRSISPGWAQDRVSQDPKGSLCNNLPFQVGKSQGQCCDCYGAAIQAGTSPVPHRIRGDSGTCSSLHFAWVPGKQQVSRPGILRGFPLLAGARARLVVFGIRNSCVGALQLYASSQLRLSKPSLFDFDGPATHGGRPCN